MSDREHSTAEMEEMNQEIKNRCSSGEDVYQWICEQMLPAEESDELSEDSLEFVTGGMADHKALQIISTAYWDLVVEKRGKTRYSDLQIFEALNHCHRISRQAKHAHYDIGKITTLIMRELNA